MRTLKFRAWEKKLKEMIPVSTVDFNEEVINTNSLWRFFHEVDLMQYTGLKDKNGTDIYEGDIYQDIEGWGDLKTKKYLVKYSEERAGYFPFATDDGCGCCADDVVFNPEEDGEIIGNIYENPELLEEVI